MKIGLICRRNIASIDASSTVEEAASLMREKHVGALVVTSAADDGQHVRGIVTDRDMTIEVLACGIDGAGVRVGDLASTTLVMVSESSDSSEAIMAMQESGVRRVLVRNDDGRLAGIVALDDLLDACARDMAGLARIVRSGIERESLESTIGSPPAPTLRVPAIGTASWTSVVV